MEYLSDNIFYNLLEKGDFPSIKYYYKQKKAKIAKPMIYAVLGDNIEFAEFLLKLYPNTNMNRYNDLCFRLACRYNCRNMVRWLAQFNPDISANGNEAFHSIIGNLENWCEDYLDIFFNNSDFMEENFQMLFNKSLNIKQKHFPLNNVIFLQYLRKIENSNKTYFSVMFTKQFLEEVIAKYEQLFFTFKNLQTYIAQIARRNHVFLNNIAWLEEKINLFKLPIKLINGVVTRFIYLEEKETCFICYNKDVEIQTNCKHNFCNECIHNWMNRKNNCPLCRTEIYQIKEILYHPKS